MLSDEDRDNVDLLFVRTRSGDAQVQQDAWRALETWAHDTERRDYLRRLAQADAAMDQLHRAPPMAVAKRRPWLPLALAASLAVVASGLWWLNPELSNTRYATSVGEQKELTLSDGSRLVLNTDSELAYSARLHSREVQLVRGEVLFDVERSVLRPFYVHSVDAQVRVVGTLFSVRRLANGSLVKVARGQVEVRAQGDAQAQLLSAGQQVQTGAGRFTGSVRPVDVGSVSGWSDGRLVFDAVPLREALAELQRYRKAPIVLADNKLGDLKLTGSFSSREPDRILELLPVIFELQVTTAADGTARISKR